MIDWAILLCGAFLAGLVDAVVGGGGLIQLPLLLALMPGVSAPILFATNKMSSVAGTASAALEYARKITIPKSLVVPAVVMALIGAACGAAIVSWVPGSLIRPAVLVLLLVVGTYTFIKPDFGSVREHYAISRKSQAASGLAGFCLGLYDGIFGPGTGSFLIFIFVRYFGMDLIHASASSKIVNLATNIAALSFFLCHDGVLLGVGIAMALANILGAQVGLRLALRRGNKFIRYVLLVVLAVLFIKLSYDSVRAFIH